MTDAITRCPKCHTSFRLNEELLHSAKGSVRCGSCLTIFNAKENILPSHSQEENEKEGAAKDITPKDTISEHTQIADTEEKQTSNENEELIHDNAPISDSSEDDREELVDSNEFDENVFVAHYASKSEINLFERRIKEEGKRELENADPDESWALSLLDEEGDEPQKETPTEEAKLKAENKNPFKIIEEDDTSSDEYREFENDIEDQLHQEHVDEEPPVEEIEFEEPSSLYPHSRTDFLEAIEPEPLELSVPNQNPIWQHNGFWFALSVFAGLLLIYQLALYNFDDFSRKQSLRPYYLQTCRIFSCQVPAMEDLNLIKVQNMVVVDHPNVNDMLLVDATLLNHADFAQTFPTLQLTFTNIGNEVVSKMLFPPDTYVGGELSGTLNMPAKHPIHITLELADPGADAVNYQIAIVKP